jgi:D-tyrosyl-tRNA(Tyr) deacylase
MRLVLQRVARASVEVAGERVAAIGRGLLVFAGIAPGDGEAEVAAAAAKIATMRLFEDAAGKMNLALGEVGGSVLLVSQFTLLAATARGRRPSFTGAARPEVAAPLVDRLAERLAAHGVPVERGRFGAAMAVELLNDGPVTLVLDLPAGDLAGGADGARGA